MKRDLILPRHNETSSDNQAINVSKMFGLVTKFLWLLRPFWIWWSPPFLKFVVVRRRHAVDAVRLQELGDPLHRPLAVVLSLQYKNKHLSKTLYYTQSEYCLFFWFFCSPGLIENLALYWIERFNKLLYYSHSNVCMYFFASYFWLMYAAASVRKHIKYLFLK